MTEIILDPSQLALKENIKKLATMAASIPAEQEAAHTVIAVLLDMMQQYEKMNDGNRRIIRQLTDQVNALEVQIETMKNNPAVIRRLK